VGGGAAAAIEGRRYGEQGQRVVGGEVCVAIGNGAGPGKGCGPKGRPANILGIAARKNEILQCTGRISLI
jgi:hypothetical protein